jgi:hypothetical protein
MAMTAHLYFNATYLYKALPLLVLSIFPFIFHGTNHNTFPYLLAPPPPYTHTDITFTIKPILSER